MSGDRCVLGISAHYHDAAAALVVGGRIVAAAQEERFTRVKADWRFPEQAITYCLSMLPPGKQLDAVGFYEDPRLKLDRLVKRALAAAPRGAENWPKLLRRITETGDLLQSLRRLMPDDRNIFVSAHHRSHAASAFFPSRFEDSAVLVVDGVGEWSTASIWNGKGSSLTLEWEASYPDSLGLFYSALTQYCGFQVNTGEYKLMGLAPFGEPVFAKMIRDNVLTIEETGDFSLNPEYFAFETTGRTISPRLPALFGHPSRRPEDPLSPHFMNVAASVQQILNEAMCALARKALRLTGSRNLCMAGGVALNCVSNTHVVRSVKDLEGMWIQPAAGDAGGALGVAMDVSIRLGAQRGKCEVMEADAMQHACLGPEYDVDAMLAALDSESLTRQDFRERDDEFAEAVATLLSDGNVIGYFDGRMEFGPRALGNRSILADARAADTLSRVNKRIKFREAWRPLAPVILEEFEADIYDHPIRDPYMLFTADLKPEFRNNMDMRALRGQGLTDVRQIMARPMSKFPAVTHLDFSARSQTLSRSANKRLHSIMTAFHTKTGCPLLLNTSFNVRGEPIVCSPQDAVAAFLNTHLDALVIGPFVVLRSQQRSDLSSHIGRTKFRAD